MSRYDTLPTEVVEFFKKKKGNTLLIKGAPGSGKTIFALTLLRSIIDKKNGAYVTTRINRKHLLNQFPEVKEIIKPDNIVEATKTKFPEKSKEEIMDVDYVTMSEFLLALLDKVENIKDPLLVIDSWDAIISRLDENRIESEHDLIDFATKTNIKLILIAEHEEDRELDYFVDGIITLRMNSIKGRTQREINISKLRGVKIQQPTYLFTLQNGTFKVFKPFRLKVPLVLDETIAISDTNESHISTGILDFDQILEGGYQKGSFNLLELKHGVGGRDVILIAPTIINALAQKRHVFIFSTDCIREPIIENIINCLKIEDIGNYIKIQEEIFDSKNVPEYVFPAKGKSIEEDMAPICKLRRDHMKKETTFSILGFDRLEHIYGKDAVKKIIWKFLRYAQSRKQVDIGIIHETQKEILDLVGPMATTHWKVESRYNTVVMYGIIPQTGYYVIEQDHSKKDCLSSKLVPMV